jgi:hypothetical protein
MRARGLRKFARVQAQAAYARERLAAGEDPQNGSGLGRTTGPPTRTGLPAGVSVAPTRIEAPRADRRQYSHRGW